MPLKRVPGRIDAGRCDLSDGRRLRRGTFRRHRCGASRCREQEPSTTSRAGKDVPIPAPLQVIRPSGDRRELTARKEVASRIPASFQPLSSLGSSSLFNGLIVTERARAHRPEIAPLILGDPQDPPPAPADSRDVADQPATSSRR